MTAGKTIALTRWTFVGKVLCLLFNMLDDYRKEEINISHPEASPGDSCKIDGLLLHPLTSSPRFYKRIWHPDPDKMVILRH